MGAPPYTNLTTFAAALTELVKDAKGGVADSVFIAHALERYAEDRPLPVTSDIGDGETREWDLTSGASPFAKFDRGLSDQVEMKIQVLTTGSVPQNPPVWLRKGYDWWIEERDVSDVSKLYLVFSSAPTTLKNRLHWGRRPRVTDSPAACEVPAHHQTAVVYLGCHLKCVALASYYAGTADDVGGSELFEGKGTAEMYRSQATTWLGHYKRILGLGGRKGTITTGRVDDGNLRVWPSWHSPQ